MATDDVHRSDQIDLGWTMIRSKKLNKTDIMEAITEGRYYASCGPTIEDFHIRDEVVSLASSPVSQIRFQFNGNSGGHVVYAEDGRTINSAEWRFSNRRPRWIRAEVIDQKGNHAWTNPIVVTS